MNRISSVTQGLGNNDKRNAQQEMPGAGHQTRCGAWPWCSCGVSTNFVTWARWISIFFHHVRLNRNLIEFGRVFRQNAFRKDVFLCSQGKEWRIGGVERRNLQRNSRFRAKILNHQVFWFLLLLFLGNNVFFLRCIFLSLNDPKKRETRHVSLEGGWISCGKLA